MAQEEQFHNQMVVMQKRLLNIKEASEYVGLSPNYIRTLIAQRLFPFKNISRGSKAVFRFDLKDLDAWVERLPGVTEKDLD